MTDDTSLREGVFYLDLFTDKTGNITHTFPGYTLDERWNGWACPYFTKEQAWAIVIAWHEFGAEAGFDTGSDEFVFGLLDDDEGESERYSATLVAGKKLFPVGNSSWIWDEVS